MPDILSSLLDINQTEPQKLDLNVHCKTLFKNRHRPAHPLAVTNKKAGLFRGLPVRTVTGASLLIARRLPESIALRAAAVKGFPCPSDAFI